MVSDSPLEPSHPHSEFPTPSVEPPRQAPVSLASRQARHHKSCPDGCLAGPGYAAGEEFSTRAGTCQDRCWLLPTPAPPSPRARPASGFPGCQGCAQLSASCWHHSGSWLSGSASPRAAHTAPLCSCQRDPARHADQDVVFAQQRQCPPSPPRAHHPPPSVLPRLHHSPAGQAAAPLVCRQSRRHLRPLPAVQGLQLGTVGERRESNPSSWLHEPLTARRWEMLGPRVSEPERGERQRRSSRDHQAFHVLAGTGACCPLCDSSGVTGHNYLCLFSQVTRPLLWGGLLLSSWVRRARPGLPSASGTRAFGQAHEVSTADKA